MGIRPHGGAAQGPRKAQNGRAAGPDGGPSGMSCPAGRRGHAPAEAGCCDWLRVARSRTRVRYPETVRFARLLLT